MLSSADLPFVDSRAYNKANRSYVVFPSQVDAMLASLQLFHDVPCRIMDIFFSVVTHPDFDSKQVTSRNSIDVIDVVEESRLKDRMAIVHERSASREGHAQQAGFPHFALYEVLDIFNAKRMESIRAYFEKTLYDEALYRTVMHVDEDYILEKMSLVHRTSTLPAQKALGRILYIGRPKILPDLLRPVQKSIFGPWTFIVAMQLYQPIEEVEYGSDRNCIYRAAYHIRDEYRQWYETIHRILVSFTNLRTVLVQSYAPYFTQWSDSTIEEMLRRNMYLEEATLYSTRNEGLFNLDPLIKNSGLLQKLRTLNLQGANFFDATGAKAMKGSHFERLSSLTIKRSTASLKTNITMLSILSPQLKSSLRLLHIINPPKTRKYWEGESDSERENISEREEFSEKDMSQAFTATQCATLFNSLRALHIDGRGSTDHWFKWIAPYCLSLESLCIVDFVNKGNSFEKDITEAFTPSQSTTIFEQLVSLQIVSTDSETAEQCLQWIGQYCLKLENFTLKTDPTLPFDVLSLIPSSIQSLDLRLMATEWTNLEDIIDWIDTLSELISSRHFSKLNYIKLFYRGTAWSTMK